MWGMGFHLGRRSRSHTPQNNQAGSQHQSACHHNKNPVQTKKKNPQTLYTNQRIVIDEATDCSDKPNKRQASGINAWKTLWGPVAKALLSFKMIEERVYHHVSQAHWGQPSKNNPSTCLPLSIKRADFQQQCFLNTTQSLVIVKHRWANMIFFQRSFDLGRRGKQRDAQLDRSILYIRKLHLKLEL